MALIRQNGVNMPPRGQVFPSQNLAVMTGRDTIPSSFVLWIAVSRGAGNSQGLDITGLRLCCPYASAGSFMCSLLIEVKSSLQWTTVSSPFASRPNCPGSLSKAVGADVALRIASVSLSPT